MRIVAYGGERHVPRHGRVSGKAVYGLPLARRCRHTENTSLPPRRLCLGKLRAIFSLPVPAHVAGYWPIPRPRDATPPITHLRAAFRTLLKLHVLRRYPCAGGNSSLGTRTTSHCQLRSVERRRKRRDITCNGESGAVAGRFCGLNLSR